MRNYIKAYSCRVTADSTGAMTYFGDSPDQALAIARSVANSLTSSGYMNVQVVENPPIYLLLNHARIMSILINMGNGSQPTQGQLVNNQFNNFLSISQQLGLDPSVSPKLQKVRPWNGRKK